MPPWMITWPNLTIDVIYTVILFIACMIIAVKTWKFYQLSNHKGLKYFSATFFFMGISNILSLFIPLLSTIFKISPRDLFIPFMGIPVAHFIHITLSFCMSIAVLSLLLSVIWKMFGKHSDQVFGLLFIISLLFTIPWMFIRSRPAFLLIHTIIIITAAILGLYKYFTKTKKKRKSFYIVYFMLFLFWLVHTAGSFLIRFSWVSGLILYCLSLALISIILYRVIRIRK